MSKTGWIVGLILWAQTGTTVAQEAAGTPDLSTVPVEAGATAAVNAPSARHFQLGVAFLPVLLGRLATGRSGAETSSSLDSTYGIGLSFSYRVLAGLSIGIAPQILFHLTSKDDAGYSVIDSEKEYDLMARLAYAYAVTPNLDLYVEALSGYSFVTYNRIIVGSQAPRARGLVGGGGLGAAYSITERFFLNAGVGYQLGSQVSHGISDRDVKTRFLRIALGGGVKF